MAVCSNTDKSHKQNSDSKRPDTKKYILSDPIYIMLKKTNSPLALDIKILTTFERRKGYLLEESMKEDSRILFPDLFEGYTGIFWYTFVM